MNDIADHKPDFYAPLELKNDKPREDCPTCKDCKSLCLLCGSEMYFIGRTIFDNYMAIADRLTKELLKKYYPPGLIQRGLEEAFYKISRYKPPYEEEKNKVSPKSKTRHKVQR
jgi:hypothetical protein